MMKKFTKIGLIIAIIALAVSCSDAPSMTVPEDNPEITQPNTPPASTKITRQDGINYLGDVSKIYSSPSRFVTGQIIDDFRGHKVRFEANLVEYFIIKPEILEYVESLESNNALMHQNYENVTYDPNKKYVEFASYTDTTSGKVVCFEIRVFYGNFLETYNTQGWYAKSVSFNSSFTKNIDSGVAVNFGTPLGNEEDDTVSSNTTDTSVDEGIDEELIKSFGTPENIYSAQSIIARSCTGQIFNWGDQRVRFQGNLVAYTSVNPIIFEAFYDVELNAMLNQGYSNVSYDKTKTYIEVCYYADADTNEIISYELRLVDSSYFNHSYTNWYAKSIQFDVDEYNAYKGEKVEITLPDEDKEIIDLIGTGNVITSRSDTYQSDGKEVREQTYLLAYTALNPKVSAKFDKEEASCNTQYGYNILYDQSLIYIEATIYQFVETQKIYYIDLRLMTEAYFDTTSNIPGAKSIHYSDVSEINYEIPKTSDNPVTQQIIDLIGEAEAVYSDDDSVTGFIFDSDYRMYTSLVAFNSVSSKIEEIFDEITQDSGVQSGSYKHFSFEDCTPQYTYIEIIYCETIDTNEICFYELNRFNESWFSDPKPPFTTKCFHFYDLSEIQEDGI